MQFGQVRLHITFIVLGKAFYHHSDHSSVIKRHKFDIISGASKQRNKNQYEYAFSVVTAKEGVLCCLMKPE